jgi:hypothetical protein
MIWRNQTSLCGIRRLTIGSQNPYGSDAFLLQVTRGRSPEG